MAIDMVACSSSYLDCDMPLLLHFLCLDSVVFIVVLDAVQLNLNVIQYWCLSLGAGKSCASMIGLTTLGHGSGALRLSLHFVSFRFT